jgi:hypothetical protein
MRFWSVERPRLLQAYRPHSVETIPEIWDGVMDVQRV